MIAEAISAFGCWTKDAILIKCAEFVVAIPNVVGIVFG